MDLIASDGSRIQAAFFSMSEANLRAALRRPWVGICSDSVSMAPEGAFLRAPVHPRAYGSFARVLGHYAFGAKSGPKKKIYLVFRMSEIYLDFVRQAHAGVTMPARAARPGNRWSLCRPGRSR
jgi:hypothetical protein